MSNSTQPGDVPTDDLLERFEAWKDQASESEEPIPAEFAELAAGGALLRETLNHEIDAIPDAAFAAMWSRVEAQIEEEAQPWWSRAMQRWTQGWRLPVGALAGVCGAALVWSVVQPERSSTEKPQQMRSAQLPEGASATREAAAPSDLPQPAEDHLEMAAKPVPSRVAERRAMKSAPGKKEALRARKRMVAAVDAQASEVLEPAAQMPQEEEMESPEAKEESSSTGQGQGIERIDFARGGGRIGTIERPRGTTTVVWIDASPRASADGPAMDL